MSVLASLQRQGDSSVRRVGYSHVVVGVHAVSSDRGVARFGRLEFRVYAVLGRLKAELRTAQQQSCTRPG
jgi:hypothetical protein